VCLVDIDYDTRGTIKSYVRSCKPLSECLYSTTGVCNSAKCCARTPDNCFCRPGSHALRSDSIIVPYSFLAHSKNELMQWRDVRRLSVCPSVCKLLCKSLLLADKWPDRDQTCRRWSPGHHASRVWSRSRSKVTWYAHFLGLLEWATPSLTVWLAHSKNELIQWRGVRRLSVCPFVHLSVCKLLRKSLLFADKWPDRHQTFTRWTPGQHASRVCSRSRSRSRSRSKVTWYAHLLGFLEWATPSLTVWFISLLCELIWVARVGVESHILCVLLCCFVQSAWNWVDRPLLNRPNCAVASFGFAWTTQLQFDTELTVCFVFWDVHDVICVLHGIWLLIVLGSWFLVNDGLPVSYWGNFYGHSIESTGPVKWCVKISQLVDI